MDGLQLFKRLGVGAKFDFKRFSGDAEKLKIISNPPVRQSIEANNGNSISYSKRKNEYTNDKTSVKKMKTVPESSEDDSDNSSESEPETELKILDNITSKGGISNQRLEKKKKVKTKEKLAALHKEEVNRLRNQHKIHVYGTDLPEPMKCFGDLVTNYKLNSAVLNNITDISYTEPTPIQRQAIPAMLHRREIMACAPTGSGKTAAFVIPIIHHLHHHSNKGFRALVLAPSRELAKQIYRDFQRLSEGTSLKLHYIEKVNSDEDQQIPPFDILVSTPNRLIYQLKQDSPQISLSNVEWLVVDESDKLFEEGKTGFRDQLAVIYKACDSKNVRRAMFSATFAYDVEEWCRLNLDNVIQIYVGARNSATQTIEQELQFVGTEYGKLFAIREIIQKGIQPPILVFVQSKERAQELFSELIYDGMNVDVIHSERPQAKRDEVVTNFRCGKVWILICTELMGRGIDFKGVNLVINYDFPNSAISYIHRVGRTGRAGRSGKAITFFTEEDGVNLRSIANIMVEAGCPVPQYMLQIKRPSKKKRKKLSKRVPKREHISTAIKSDIAKAKKKREIVKKQKLKKLNGPSKPVQKNKHTESSNVKRKSKLKKSPTGKESVKTTGKNRKSTSDSVHTDKVTLKKKKKMKKNKSSD